MLFDYRSWLRRFLEWLLNDAEDDESKKMVTKGLIGEAQFFWQHNINKACYQCYLHTCVVTAEIKFERIRISGVACRPPF